MSDRVGPRDAYASKNIEHVRANMKTKLIIILLSRTFAIIWGGRLLSC